MSNFKYFLLFVSLFLIPSPALGKVITSDMSWSGEVLVAEDILIPEGVTLTVLPGTVVRISPAESTKTDPEFMSPLTELMVRGTLIAEGTRESPVTFFVQGEKKSAWAGIIIDGGRAVLNSCIIRDAETGIDAVKGSVHIRNSLLIKNRYGLSAVRNDADIRIEDSTVKDNDYGMVLLQGAKVESRDTVVKENSKKDTVVSAAVEYSPSFKVYTPGKRETSRIYSDTALLGLTIWEGRIEVNGIVRVPENSRLIIMPGTIVEFSRKDTNNDGIGENGILIQGMIIAKGTREQPIFFGSAEKQKRMGDWDAINIMNSDKTQNLIEFCQIEDGYRGLHFHFSNVGVHESVLRNNYRGIQFQESVVEIMRTRFLQNKSALQARDSEILFLDNVVYHNYSGINLLRNAITVRGNAIISNDRDGLRIREGLSVVEENLMDGNRYGLMVADATYGTFSRNVITRSSESGIALRATDNIEVHGNLVQRNGLNGISIQDSGGVIRSNLISDNGERGIGVLSFHGIITENNILKNGLYNLGIDGEADVSAPINWWGGDDLKKTIYDKEDDPSRGRADYLPVRREPVSFPWPLKTLSADTLWHGQIIIDGSLTVMRGVALVVSPGTKILFSNGAGLTVHGRITAKGSRDARIIFSSVAGKGAGDWEEILLDYATGSQFSDCTFEHATWALHSHFTDLKVEGCSFRKNVGGMRFTSGPIEIKQSLFRGNEIGIRAYRGTAAVTQNVITGNRIGIFVREKGSGLKIRNNNIFSNTEYNMRLGDFNDEDVDAGFNWWGSSAPADTIFDDRKDPGIGRVKFEPYEQHPFLIELIDGFSDDRENPMKTGFGAGTK